MIRGRRTSGMAARPDPPPPGETGIELTGGGAIEVMHALLQAVTAPAAARVVISDVRKVGRWFTVDVALEDVKAGRSSLASVRITRTRLAWLRDRCTRVLAR